MASEFTWGNSSKANIVYIPDLWTDQLRFFKIYVVLNVQSFPLIYQYVSDTSAFYAECERVSPKTITYFNLLLYYLNLIGINSITVFNSFIKFNQSSLHPLLF